MKIFFLAMNAFVGILVTLQRTSRRRRVSRHLLLQSGVITISYIEAKQPLTMEQKFGINSIDIKVLREFCKREGKMVEYRKAVTFSEK